ncbi:hypothetical protein M3Y97_01136300 [Aphelenchoides bicaudatus]|nr:hypothetical protein M3Y97_01136300 [Aphelenchoides bicaudatus]
MAFNHVPGDRRRNPYLYGNMRLTTAAQIIGWSIILFAIVGIFTSIGSIVYNAIKTNDEYLSTNDRNFNKSLLIYSGVNIGLTFITIGVTLGMLVGVWNRRPVLFWPYLVYMGIEAFWWLVGTILCLSLAIMMLSKRVDGMSDGEKTAATIVLFVCTLLGLLVTFFVVYFGIVVINQTRLVIQEEQELLQSPPPIGPQINVQATDIL